MTRPIITLLSDFGGGSCYVAQVKGVILSIAPDVNLVDVCHDLPPQDVRGAALLLADVCRWFPPGTIHVAVVDPGVGSGRRILHGWFDQRQALAPDNGLLSRLALATPNPTIRAVTASEFRLPEVSRTFHGRDLFAPLAARLALGLAPERLGPPLSDWLRLEWPEVRVSAGKVEGVVESIDSFGNLITNIPATALADAPRDERLAVVCDEHETRGLFATYADQPEMTLIALVGSSGKLELAIVGDSAAAMLGVRVGTAVVAKWDG